MSDNSNENVQIYPSKTRIVPNFKLAKIMCNLSEEKFDGMVVDGYDNTDPLNEFDRAVLSVCISEWVAGNRYTTPSVIYRALTGKVGDSDANPSLNQRDEILNSIMKLMNTLIWIDDTETNEALGYETTDASKKCSAILPAYFVEKTVNGQDATVIFFDRVSPIMTIAEQRSQILRFDASLLDVPNQNNTPRVITIKNCIMNRVMEIKLHKMTPTITFDDLFRKCRITDASRKTKMDARETAKIFFEHLKSKGVINSFEIVKNGNCQFHGIF